MNSKKTKTYKPYRLLINLKNKINLKVSDKYLVLSNLSMHYTQKNIKRHTKTINLKHQLQYGMQNLNYLMDHILYQILKIILNIYLKSTEKTLIIVK